MDKIYKDPNRRKCIKCLSTRKISLFHGENDICTKCLPMDIVNKKVVLPDNFIYSIHCTASNRVYIGSTWHYESRISDHKVCLWANKHICKEMQDDYNKYGEKTFVYKLVEANNIGRKEDSEYFYIKLLSNYINLYNKSIKKNNKEIPREVLI